ncbi:ATP-binding protein [Olsenella sp. oral taxon 807]|uniref:ATP-binding protein n=1 Tax=Olsenella sp. oral taxon 807 TaxID=712411 RepID=UPI00067B3C59|nr:ATP-binding protein [Olsenella sp. oral taxon 807]
MNLGMEDERTEHKRSTGEMREGMESIASILNKHGHGTLYFGVRNDGEVVGQDVSDKTLRDVSQAVGNRIEPRIYPQIERLETPDSRAYVKVTFSGGERPYACDGRYRIRSADEDVPMSASALKDMILERAAGRDPWDGRSSGKPVSAVDEEVLRRYVARGVQAKRIPFQYTDARDVLSRLGLLCEDETLTNAAMVCFTDRSQVGLRMGVLADSDRVNILDNQQVSGPLFSLVDAGETYIVNNIRRAFVIDASVSLQRREVPEIPLDAIREALYNAFSHRVYETNAAVQIDIFWDSVDIYSPGPFPPGVLPDDFLAGRSAASNPRNVLIAQTLYRSGDIESYGTGLQRIRRSCEAQGTPVEVFERASSVHVKFTRQEALDGVGRLGPFAGDTGNPPKSAGIRRNPPESAGNDRASDWLALPTSDRSVCEYLSAHGPSSPREISAALNIPVRTLRDIAGRLEASGLISSSGTTKNRTYELWKRG